MSSILSMDTLRLPVSLCVLLTLIVCALANYVHTASLDLPTDMQSRNLDTVRINN